MSLRAEASDHVWATSGTRSAHEKLLDYVEAYFSASARDPAARLQMTQKAPIYLQEPGHSRTIVGLELLADGRRNLLTFDPSFEPPSSIRQLLVKSKGSKSVKVAADQGTLSKAMRTYRRTEAQLARHLVYETLTYGRVAPNKDSKAEGEESKAMKSFIRIVQ